MPTFISNEVAPSTYVRLRCVADVTYTSVTFHVELLRTAGNYDTGSNPGYFNADGTQTNNGSTGGTQGMWAHVPGWAFNTWRAFSETVTKTYAAGSHTVNWSTIAPYSSYIQGGGTITFTTTNQTTNPDKPTVSLTSRTPTSVTANVKIGSYGTPSSATGRYIELGVLGSTNTTYGAPYKHASASNTLSSSITVNNSSTGGLTLAGGMPFKIGGYANNTQATNSIIYDAIYYLPPEQPSTVTVSGTWNHVNARYNITASVTGSSSNYASAKVDTQIRYKINNDAYTDWITIATDHDPTVTKTYSINGPSVRYTNITVEARQLVHADPTQISAAKSVVRFFTAPAHSYWPIENEAKEIKKAYFPKAGLGKRVRKIYIGVNNQAKLGYIKEN